MHLMKNITKGMLLLAVAATLTLSSCRREIPPPPSSGNCEQTGTIERVPCATGAWGDLWIRTSNNKLLKPCNVLVPNFQPKDGMKIRFSAVDPQTKDCVEKGDPTINCIREAVPDMIKN